MFTKTLTPQFVLLSLTMICLLPGNAHAQQASFTLPATNDVLRLTVDHPEKLRAGRSYDYVIRVENVSDQIVVHDVKLEQQSKGSFSVESATIDGEKQSSADSTEKTSAGSQSDKGGDSTHTWTIAKLAPGQSQSIKVRAVSDDEGEANLCFAVKSYTPTLCIAPRFVKPDVQLTKSAPEQVSLCEVIHYEYTVTNTGTGNPGSFEIVDKLGDLETETGDQTLRFTVDGLEAGQTRKFVADIVATKSGEYSSRAEAILGDGDTAKSKKTTTKVISPELAVAIDGPRTAYSDQPLQYSVRVTNRGNADAEDVEMQVFFPTAMELTNLGRVQVSDDAVSSGDKDRESGKPTPAEQSSQTSNDSANDNEGKDNEGKDKGSSQQADAQTDTAMENRSVRLGNLRAGETKRFALTLRGSLEEKVLPLRAEAKFTCQPGDSDEQYEVTAVGLRKTELVSLPALLVAVVDETDPIKVNDKVVYEIVVRNQGTAADENVQIVAELPEQLEFVSADGKTKAESNGNKVTFGEIARMAPGERAVWRVHAKAKTSGDARFKVRLNSKSLTEPAISEEPTKLFGE